MRRHVEALGQGLMARDDAIASRDRTIRALRATLQLKDQALAEKEESQEKDKIVNQNGEARPEVGFRTG